MHIDLQTLLYEVILCTLTGTLASREEALILIGVNQNLKRASAAVSGVSIASSLSIQTTKWIGKLLDIGIALFVFEQFLGLVSTTTITSTFRTNALIFLLRQMFRNGTLLFCSAVLSRVTRTPLKGSECRHVVEHRSRHFRRKNIEADILEEHRS
uniref:Uncharacterized protein n=1 Tax=Strigamia maritima TaxID=126957 RepID=T1J3K9_STRMM